MGLIMDVVEQYNEAVFEKARLDKWFSLFLDKNGNKLDKDESYSCPEWVQYKTMLKTYNEVDHRVRTLKYKLSNG